MKTAGVQSRAPKDETAMAVRLKALAHRLDAHRSSVRRWLREADSDADACRLSGEPGTLSE
jgi:hypothetical protein